MTEALGGQLSYQMEKMREIICAHNQEGEICGLFSHHILSRTPEFKIEWSVKCDKEWLDNTFEENNAHHISSLGYSISTRYEKTAEDKFIKAFNLLKKRNHFKGTHLTFPYHPLTFLGIVLGMKSLKNLSIRRNGIEWLTLILEERNKIGQISRFHNLFYKYIKHQLMGQPIQIGEISEYSSLEELALLEFGVMKNIFQIPNQHENLEQIRKNMLTQLLETAAEDIEPEKTPIIWFATNKSITKQVDNLLISPSFVSSILSRFEAAMRRWRYDPENVSSPVRWLIRQEREVQDITWLILRSYFDDLVDEETLPKFGHSSYKPDFGIPSLSLLVEIKYARKKEDFKLIEKEIMQDAVGYLAGTQQYEKIIVFIYDASCSVQEHNITRRDLIKIKGIEDVIIVSKPSQIP